MKLSLQQLDIYYEQVLFPELPVFNIGARVELYGALNVAAMQAAYTRLVQQHDVLRSYVSHRNEDPEWLLLENYNHQLGYIDLSEDDAAEQMAEAYIFQQFRIGFNLHAAEPLHRHCLIRIAENRYCLLSVFHHLVTDGWGTSLLFARFAELYTDLVQSGEFKHNYGWTYEAFSNYSNEYIDSEKYLADSAYWRQKFEYLPDCIPTTKANDLYSFESDRCHAFISPDDFRQLGQLAANANATTLHVILAALFAYFNRVNRSADFAIGLPVLNRGSKAFKNTAGLFASLCALRMTIDPNQSFIDLIAHIKNELRKDYRHQEFPLGHLVRQLNIQNDRTQLFNITLSYEKHNYDYHFGSTAARVLPLTHGYQRVALAIGIREYKAEDDVRIDFDFNTSYFSKEDAQRMAKHVTKLLREVVAKPEAALHDINFVTEEEYHQCVHEFNDTKIDLPPDTTVVELFRQTCSLHADKTAVADLNTTLSFRQLDRQSDYLAAIFAQLQQTSTEAVIGIMMDRSAAMLATMLGIMKCGCAYLPLDPSFPEKRIRYIIENSGCAVIAADKQYHSFLKSIEGVMLLDVTLPGEMQLPRHAFQSKAVAGSLAYIMYTSGSTGQPKGVEIQHLALVNFLLSMQSKPGIDVHDRLLAVTSYSFDISLLELFLPLIAGATVYIAGQPVVSDPAALMQLMQQFSPTIMQGTASLWNMLFVAGWQGDAALKVLCGGEPLNHTTAIGLTGGCGEVWNVYGPTETTIWSTANELTDAAGASVIGTPIANTTVYILDPWLNLQPVNSVGEIFIGGAGLARGYRNNAEATSQRFLENPFVPGQRMYRTGDLGKMLNNGKIEFCGRADDQVKVRGHRIELGEIEKQLLLMENISEAVAGTVPGSDGINYLVAWVVLHKSCYIADIAEGLKEFLPSYMIPSRIVPVKQIPLTPNGKIDRKSLASQTHVTAADERIKILPQNAGQQSLKLLWEEVLNEKEIGIADNFFLLGGHSLNGVRLMRRIEEHFDVRLPLRVLFSHPTIQKLYPVIAQQKTKLETGITSTALAADYPLAPNQTGIWVACQSDNGNRAYNMSGAFQIDGQLSEHALETAFLQCMARHESLRTVFIEVNGLPRQKIIAPDKIGFHLHKHTVRSGESVEDLVNNYTDTAFHLQQGPLINACLLKIKPDRHLLVCNVHHLISDEWSLQVLMSDLAAFYKAGITESEASLKTLHIQYKDYAVWRYGQLAGKNADAVRQFWMQQLQHYRFTPSMPVDKEELLEFQYEGDSIEFSIGEENTAAFRQMLAKENATLFMGLTAVLRMLLYHVAGLQDQCIAVPFSGRTEAGTEDQVGMYANTLPLRTVVDGEMNFMHLLHTVRSALLAMDEHQSYPLTQIMEDLHFSSPALFDILMVLQDKDLKMGKTDGFPGLMVQPYPVKRATSRFLLNFEFYETGSVIKCCLVYRSDLLFAETVHALTKKFVKLLEMVNVSPRTLIKDQQVLLPYEETFLKNEINIELDF